ncbi:MAG: tetratricopeptide repeat protein [Owenweeksia sp.]|nr:tetratricopeptide repeat protein [Owenweeksia sp.]
MKSFTTVLLLLAVLTTFGQQPRELFAQGNEKYRQQQYEEAIETYHQITEQGLENASLYYNLGNAYFKSDQLAQAILYYEKAVRLAPHDDEIQQNLKIARQGTIDKFETMPRPIVQATYLALLTALSPSGWATAGLVAMLLFISGSFLYLFSGMRRPGFTLGLVGLLAGLLCLSLAYLHQNYQRQNQPAVVMAPSSYVKSGPGQKAEDVFILHGRNQSKSDRSLPRLAKN